MYLGSDAANFALLLARVWVGDHDLRPRLAAREGDPVRARAWPTGSRASA